MELAKFLSIIGLAMICLSCNSPTNQKIKTDNNKPTMNMAERIKIDGLKNVLIKLQNKQTEFNFIGITSNGIDCIYFVCENGKFNLEFEAMIKEQIPFIDKLKEYATLKNYKFLMMTYNNRPKYQSEKPAPVIRIETNSTIDQINVIGINIQAGIFKNSTETVYDVVP